jgi:small subunit ribosomal protein S6
LRRYEILLIAHADLSDDDLNELIERYNNIITNSKGTIIKIDKWGTRKLAYEIKKQTKGTYILTDFVGKSDIVPELERNFKIDDKILKYLTVLKDDEVDLQELEKEKQADTPPETIIPPLNISVESTKEGSIEGESAEDTKGVEE